MSIAFTSVFRRFSFFQYNYESGYLPCLSKSGKSVVNSLHTYLQITYLLDSFKKYAVCPIILAVEFFTADITSCINMKIICRFRINTGFRTRKKEAENQLSTDRSEAENRTWKRRPKGLASRRSQSPYTKALLYRLFTEL